MSHHEPVRDPTAHDALIKAALVGAAGAAVMYFLAPGSGMVNWFGTDMSVAVVGGLVGAGASLGNDLLHHTFGAHVSNRVYMASPFLLGGALMTAGLWVGNPAAISLMGTSPGSMAAYKAFALGAGIEWVGLAAQSELMKTPLVSDLLQ